MSDPEDILSTSLRFIFSDIPVVFPSSGASFKHIPSGITLVTPDPAPSNWSLHASSVWIASLYLANHLEDIATAPLARVHVLELGAGAGLPGILFSKRHPDRATVTLSDYPDTNILRTLQENVERNGISPSLVRVVGHAWGENTTALGEFDIVIAADTLWNSEMHTPFCQTLSRVLRRNDTARAYLVVALHTGRWTIHRFLTSLRDFGLTIDQLKERRTDDFPEIGPSDSPERVWNIHREEDENELKKWIVWIVVKWTDEIVIQ